MVKASEYPVEGELVVGTVKNVKDYGAFVTIDEYGGKEGFVHIADVSSGWIKYIRDHVWEGQKVVCKVLKVKPEVGHIDLSLKSVNDRQKRLKIQEWKNEFKAENLLRLTADRTGSDYGKALEGYGMGLVKEYGSLYDAFLTASASPDEFKREHKDAWADMFISIAQNNIVPPQVTIDGTLTINCMRPEGVDVIRDALGLIEGHAPIEDVEIEVTYIGAPRYRVKVQAPDYKTAEDVIKSASQAGIDHVVRNEGQGQFVRKG
ncbi:MAG: translation initiation factor IF-2 subunit alpha [Thermoplasmata archaeon]|nr:translation initiation factor IF-2 subunit alpha [Thermoplasmata archaeon]